MPKDIHVIIVEDDPFARNWMALLVSRDRRTRLVGEVARPADLKKALDQARKDKQAADLVLLDADFPARENWLPGVLAACAGQEQPLPVVCVASAVSHQLQRELRNPQLRGFLLKNEIQYSLAWAVSLCIQERRWVFTPGVEDAMNGQQLPHPRLVLDGRITPAILNAPMQRAARLALLFSMDRSDMADEMSISDKWVYDQVSQLYADLHVAAAQHHPDDFMLNHNHLSWVVNELKHAKGKVRQIADKETLAVHILTIPYIEEIK